MTILGGCDPQCASQVTGREEVDSKILVGCREGGTEVPR